jgi:hypothetical protein
MKKIRYSKDVDALLVELSDAPISYAENDGQVILHYSASVFNPSYADAYEALSFAFTNGASGADRRESAA